MKPAVQKAQPSTTQRIVGMVMALEAMEASVTDCDSAEAGKRDYVGQLRQVLFTTLGSLVAGNALGRFHWVN